MSQRPLIYRLITFIICIGLGLSLGQIPIAAYGLAQGIDMTDSEVLMSSLTSAAHIGRFKMLVGWNHIATFILGPLAYVWYTYRKDMWQYLSLRHFDARYLIWMPLALITAYPLMGAIAQWIDSWPLPESWRDIDQSSMEAVTQLLAMDSIWSLLFTLLIVGVLPGVGEELLFRGVIQTEIHNRWRSPHAAIWLTAFLFAALHMQIAGFVPKFVIGAILGYSYYLSGSLILPMIIHTLNNSMSTLAFYLMGDQMEVDVPSESPSGVAVVTSTLVCGLVCLQIYKIYRQSSSSVLTHQDIT
jgi:uncharacterized protein